LRPTLSSLFPYTTLFRTLSVALMEATEQGRFGDVGGLSRQRAFKTGNKALRVGGKPCHMNSPTIEWWFPRLGPAPAWKVPPTPAKLPVGSMGTPMPPPICILTALKWDSVA